MQQQDKLSNEQEIGFGDYCYIEQKRYGCENEMYQHKVIGTLRSNGYVDVPVQSPAKETLHDEIIDVVACICCGVSETEVRKYPLDKIKPIRTQEVKVCDASKAEATTEADLQTPSIDYVYVPISKVTDFVLQDKGIGYCYLDKVPLSSLISKGGAEVEKLAEDYLETEVKPHCEKWNYDSVTKTYVIGASKLGFIAGYNAALTKKAGDGWKEALEALKPFAEMFGELTESKLQQKGKVFGYNRADITVDDLHYAFLAYKKLEKQ